MRRNYSEAGTRAVCDKRDTQTAVVGDREQPRIAERSLQDGLDYYSELIDRAIFPHAHYPERLPRFSACQVQDQRFDVVIANPAPIAPMFTKGMWGNGTSNEAHLIVNYRY